MWFGVAIATAIVALPSPALADAAGPTEFESEIVSITPATDTFAVTIEGGDAFVRIVADPGVTVVVLGYSGEPYLQFLPDGSVHENRRSFATYYNEERFGGEDIPAIVDNGAEPEWAQVASANTFAWHDHRAHWMGTDPPLGLDPGDSLPVQIIDVVVDGQPVEIGVETTLLPSPSWWPVIIGGLIGLAIAAASVRLGGAAAVVVLAAGGVLVGAAQFLSLPPETGPSTIWWLLPVAALLIALGALVARRFGPLIVHALAAIASIQLVLWGFDRRAVLVRPVLPTDLPFWVDRAITGAVLSGAAVLAATAVAQLLRRPAAAD